MTIAVIALVAGISMLRGGSFGLIMGFVGAGISMLRWMFYIPVAPWLSLAVIAIDIFGDMGGRSACRSIGSPRKPTSGRIARVTLSSRPQPRPGIRITHRACVGSPAVPHSRVRRPRDSCGRRHQLR